MRIRRLILILVAVATLAVGGAPLPAQEPLAPRGARARPQYRSLAELDRQPFPYSDVEAYRLKLLQKLNNIRKSQNLPPLIFSVQLSEVALSHSRDMYRRRFVDHFNAEGEDHAARLARIRPRLIVLQCRENIAFLESNKLQAEADLIDSDFNGLMNSPPHREAILSTDTTHVGFGVTISWDGKSFESNQVQIFGDIAGEWDAAFPPIVKPGSQFAGRLVKPVDLFLASDREPERTFSDPNIPTRQWVGGLPLSLSASDKRFVAMVPQVPPGVYTIRCSAKGRNAFMDWGKIRVGQ